MTGVAIISPLGKRWEKGQSRFQEIRFPIPGNTRLGKVGKGTVPIPSGNRVPASRDRLESIQTWPLLSERPQRRGKERGQSRFQETLRKQSSEPLANGWKSRGHSRHIKGEIQSVGVPVIWGVRSPGGGFDGRQSGGSMIRRAYVTNAFERCSRRENSTPPSWGMGYRRRRYRPCCR